MIPIVHLALRHSHEDSRVFYRECLSLAKRYEVTLLCAGPDQKDSDKQGVRVISFGGMSFIKKCVRAWSFLQEQKKSLQVVHAHEVETFFIGLLYKLFHPRKILIFDVHEYFEEYGKIGVNNGLHWYVKVFFLAYGWIIKPIFPRFANGIITISPIMQQEYRRLGSKNGEVIYNFPDRALIDGVVSNNLLDPAYRYLVYHGGLSADRGVFRYLHILSTLKNEPIRLLLMGRFSSAEGEKHFWEEVHNNHLEDKVIYTGQLSFLDTIAYLKNPVQYIGLSIFSYQRDHQKAINMKVFEYLTLGIPQVGSSYRLYFTEFITSKGGGIGVDYNDLSEQCAAIHTIFSHYSEWKQQTIALAEEYSWKTEEQKLFSLYETLLTKK